MWDWMVPPGWLDLWGVRRLQIWAMLLRWKNLFLHESLGYLETFSEGVGWVWRAGYWGSRAPCLSAVETDSLRQWFILNMLDMVWSCDRNVDFCDCTSHPYLGCKLTISTWTLQSDSWSLSLGSKRWFLKLEENWIDFICGLLRRAVLKLALCYAGLLF